MGVRGRGLGAVAVAAVDGLTPYFFGVTSLLGDCRFLVATAAVQVL